MTVELAGPSATLPATETPTMTDPLRTALEAVEAMASDRDYDTVTAVAAAGLLREALAAEARPGLDVEALLNLIHCEATCGPDGASRACGICDACLVRARLTEERP